MNKKILISSGALASIVVPLATVISCNHEDNSEEMLLDQQFSKINDEISSLDSITLKDSLNLKKKGDFISIQTLGIRLWKIDNGYVISNVILNSDPISFKSSLKILIEITKNDRKKTKEITIYASDSEKAYEVKLEKKAKKVRNISSTKTGSELAQLIANKNKGDTLTIEELGITLWDLPTAYVVTFTLNIDPSAFDNEFLPIIVNMRHSTNSKQKEITVYASDSIYIEKKLLKEQFDNIINLRSTKTASELNSLVKNLSANSEISTTDLGIQQWTINNDYTMTIKLKDDGNVFDQERLNIIVTLTKGEIISNEKIIRISAQDYQDIVSPKFKINKSQKWDDAKIIKNTLTLLATDDPEATTWKDEIEAAIKAIDDVEGWITPVYHWINDFDITTPGSYPLRVEATDSLGNLASYILMVFVK